MSVNEQAAELFTGFSKLDRQQRLQRLMEMGALTPDDVQYLKANQTPQPQLAENFIENVVGYFQLPLGVATNFRIDGKDYAIPMAVEETSIIAAVSKTARWVRDNGELHTNIQGDTIIGQVQIANVKNIKSLKKLIDTNKDYLISLANNEVAANLVKRGGGVRDIALRTLERGDGHDMAIIHIHADTCDAMGANMLIQICEYMKDPIEQLTTETVTMCILSNLNDSKLTEATAVIRNIDPVLGEKIAEASLFAQVDPYRAATHNKGVLNGMDPVVIATGNDWRAVEAGVHAYAARSGQYRAITEWMMEGKDLVGYFKAPVCVGTVGGMTRLHPTARMCLRMIGVEKANQLSRIIAAVGLVQNLGAIRALITLGFTEGHMKLHISNLTLGAGAEQHEIPLLKKRLEDLLAFRKRLTLTNAIELLKELRTELSTKKLKLKLSKKEQQV